MQRAVKLAVRISSINHVSPFRRPMISLPLFRPNRLAAQSNLVSPDHLARMHQLQCVSTLMYDDAICMREGVELDAIHEYKQCRTRGGQARSNPALHRS